MRKGNCVNGKNSRCCIKDWKENVEVQVQTLFYFSQLIYWSQLGSPESQRWGECALSNVSLRSWASLGEREIFALAYETARAVNIHFYLLFKLFMSIFLLYAANTWGSEQVRSLDIATNMNKQRAFSLWESFHVSWLHWKTFWWKIFGANGTSCTALIMHLCFKDMKHDDDIKSDNAETFSCATCVTKEIAM